jgi:hypothetical protein
MEALPVDSPVEYVIEQAIEKAFHSHAAIIARVPQETLSFTMIGLSQATGIGSSTLYKDAKSGKLKTHVIGFGKRNKFFVMRDDAIEYLKSFPVGYFDD